MFFSFVVSLNQPRHYLQDENIRCDAVEFHHFSGDHLEQQNSLQFGIRVSDYFDYGALRFHLCRPPDMREI